MSRDLETLVRRDNLTHGLEVYNVETHLQSDDGFPELRQHQIFLPHEILHSLWTADEAVISIVPE